MRGCSPVPTLDDRQPIAVRLDDGRCVQGTLYAWQHSERGWRGLVTYTVGVGMQHYEWLPARRLTPGPMA